MLRLPDGRDLSFAEYGDPEGIPVFGFHGTPGSRRQMAPIEGMSVPSGIRIIAPDRPGYGFSSFQPRRRLTDWPGEGHMLVLERLDEILAVASGKES